MSKYRSPLVSSDSAPKKQHRSSRYKLPFNKQEQEITKQLNTSLLLPYNQKMISNDDIKLPKLNASYEFNRELPNRRRKSNMGIHQQINISVRSQKQEMSQQQQSAHQFDHKNVLSLKEQKQISKSKLNKSKRSKRFLSSVSRYADEVDAKTQKTQEKYSSEEQSDQSRNKLPEILEIKQAKSTQNRKNTKDNYLEAWQIFQKDISEQLQEKQHKKYFKDLIKKKRRLSKVSPKRQKSQSPIIYIEKTLKQKKPQSLKLNTSKSCVDNYQFDDQSTQNRIKMKQFMERQQTKLNPLQKITQIVAIKCDKKGLAGMKLPLQFYLNAYDKIKSINPFFRKLEQLQACALLSIGRLLIVQSGKNIYKQGDRAKSIFIIIYGKALLTNKFKTLKKFSLSGQTLGQQQLFINPKNYIQRLKQDRLYCHQQTSRALIKSCLLKISLNKYYRICRELNRLGYKKQFNLIDNLFRINFINKQNNLHRNQLDRIHTDISGQPDTNHMIY